MQPPPSVACCPPAKPKLSQACASTARPRPRAQARVARRLPTIEHSCVAPARALSAARQHALRHSIAPCRAWRSLEACEPVAAAEDVPSMHACSLIMFASPLRTQSTCSIVCCRVKFGLQLSFAWLFSRRDCCVSALASLLRSARPGISPTAPQEWIADSSFAGVEIQEGKQYSDEHYESQGFSWQTEFDLRAKYGSSEEARRARQTNTPGHPAQTLDPHGRLCGGEGALRAAASARGPTSRGRPRQREE